jgi:alpha-N-acetylglucosaminidase
MWNETKAFCGKPWLWCNVQNFGGTVQLGGAIPQNNDGLMKARLDPAAGGLIGLGFVNEGLGYNPVAYDQLFEMAWRDQPVDLERWFADYARSRYGTSHPAAERAWQILRETVYTAPHRTRFVGSRVPNLKRVNGSPYDNVQLSRAWQLLFAAADDLGDRDTYQFDLVNVARQVLSNHAARLHQGLVSAYEADDAEAFAAAANTFLQLLRDLDRLLATRQEFLLGQCLEDAKRWGSNDEERDIFEWNARRVLTLWGTTQINDYARKEWSGLISGYYLPRWEWYLREAGSALQSGEPLDQERFDQELRAWMEAWSDGRESYAVEPHGDSINVAEELWQRYSDAFAPDAPSLTTGRPVTCSTSLPQHPAHLANDGYADNTERYWAMDVAGGDPAWWQVDLEELTTVGRVVVVGFFGDRRYYGFTVETSIDSQIWELVADWRDNRQLSTAEGYTCRFEPRPVRYIRVAQTGNSANTGRHLVEVMAFENP